MSLSEVFTWHRTAEALSALERLLRCDGCGRLPAQPRRYGRCAHVFCAGCVGDNATGRCTVCRAPSEARERRADTVRAALAAGCRQLRDTLRLRDTLPEEARRPPAAGEAARVERVAVKPDAELADSAERAAQCDDGDGDGGDGDGDGDGGGGGGGGDGDGAGKTGAQPADAARPQPPEKATLKRAGPPQAASAVHSKKEKRSAKTGRNKQAAEQQGSPPAGKRSCSPPRTAAAGANVSDGADVLGGANVSDGADVSGCADVSHGADVSDGAGVCSAAPEPPAGRSAQSSAGSSQASAAALSKRNSKGETRLHAACVRGDAAQVAALLAAGAAVNTQDNAGWTPLHEACEAGRADLAQLLLAAGAVADPAGHELRTPLHEAAAAGRAAVAALLVRHGADPEARCLRGTTPRQLAAGRPDVEAALAARPRRDTLSSEPVPEPVPEPATVVLATAELAAAAAAALRRTAARLGWKVAAAVSERTTHVVCGDTRPEVSVSRLRGMLVGAWLVSVDWVSSCEEADTTLPAEPWEVTGQAGRLSRRRRRLLQPPLLAGLQVYLQGSFSSPSHGELTALLQLAGARVLRRPPNPESVPADEQTVPYHAAADSPLRHTSHLVLFRQPPDIQYDMRHVKSLPLAWLLLCVETHLLVDPIR